MDFDSTAPVLGIVIEAESDAAVLRPLLANESDEISRLIGGSVEAIEIDGGSVLWMDETGKNQGLVTNLLATKIAHRLNAGLYPDDTINGRAVLLGEVAGPTGDLVSADVSAETLAALAAIGVRVAQD